MTRRTFRYTCMLGVLTSVVGTMLVGVVATSYAHHIDSMRKTQNYNVDCVDSVANPSTAIFCRTDNSSLTVYRESSIQTLGKQRIGSVLDLQFRPTDLSVTFTAPVYTGGSETDIIYRHRNLGGNLAGFAWCNDAVTSDLCDQHYVEFNSANPTKRVACHESGHAVGLVHGVDSYPAIANGHNSLGCLQAPVPLSNTGQLGTHNTVEINGAY